MGQTPAVQSEVSSRSSNQLFACKSIDKLIAEAEDPGHRLKKTLGPWSLTVLGIGAIIGSGIFVLTGTAAAGEFFQAPSILHAQVLDIIVNFPRGGGTAAVLTRFHPMSIRSFLKFRPPMARSECVGRAIGPHRRRQQLG